MHDLNDLLFFAAVVEHSGFSAAARSLNLPKSSVSRHVGRLEDRLGVRLLERSTRNVRLTEIGSSYYARCKAILSELETAEQDLALLRSDPIGTIRVSCPTGLAQYALARIVPGFLADYPLVRVQIIATNRSSSSRVPTSLIGTRSWFIHLILQVFHFSAFRKIRPGQVGI